MMSFHQSAKAARAHSRYGAQWLPVLFPYAALPAIDVQATPEGTTLAMASCSKQKSPGKCRDLK